MNNEIEVGEYVRDEDGLIFKVSEMLQDNEWDDFWIKDKFYGTWKSMVAKHSKNIIDLIETNDMVILEYYVAKYKKRITRRFEVFKCNNLVSFNNVHCDFLYNLDKREFVDGKGYNVKIKSIVTKEAFQNVSYEV